MTELHVLIVDDDPDARDLLAAMLRKRGYRVATAGNGKEGLDRLRAGPLPRVVLMDLMMPVLDGPGMALHMHADTALAAIPIVVLSADPELEHKATMMGAVSALQKPAPLRDVLANIERCVATEPA